MKGLQQAVHLLKMRYADARKPKGREVRVSRICWRRWHPLSLIVALECCDSRLYAYISVNNEHIDMVHAPVTIHTKIVTCILYAFQYVWTIKSKHKYRLSKGFVVSQSTHSRQRICSKELTFFDGYSGRIQPQPSGGSFGGTQPASGLFVPSSQPSDNMFNLSNQGTGLFGSQPNNIQPQQPPQGGSSAQPQTRSLFTQPAQQLSGNTAGASNTQPNQSSIFGGSTLVGGSSSIL